MESWLCFCNYIKQLLSCHYICGHYHINFSAVKCDNDCTTETFLYSMRRGVNSESSPSIFNIKDVLNHDYNGRVLPWIFNSVSWKSTFVIIL